MSDRLTREHAFQPSARPSPRISTYVTRQPACAVSSSTSCKSCGHGLR
jgi:hypothetical protein